MAKDKKTRKPGKPGRRKKKIDPEQIIEALNATGGNLLRAAEMLGVNRSTLYLRLNKSAKLRKAREAAEEILLDEAEDSLRNKIKSKDAKNNNVLIFYLRTKGKRRGFIESQTHHIDADVEQGVILIAPPPKPKPEPNPEPGDKPEATDE